MVVRPGIPHVDVQASAGREELCRQPFRGNRAIFKPYTYERAKSLTGKAPIGYFLASVASIGEFYAGIIRQDPEAIEKRKLGDEVRKVDDYGGDPAVRTEQDDAAGADHFPARSSTIQRR